MPQGVQVQVLFPAPDFGGAALRMISRLSLVLARAKTVLDGEPPRYRLLNSAVSS